MNCSAEATMRRILLVNHTGMREERVEPQLRAKGCEVEWCFPATGERLPGDGSAYEGVVVFGGYQSANDGATIGWLGREIDWIAAHVEAGGAYLGICLGSQLLARALGAKVGPHPAGVNQIGYYPLTPTAAGAALFPEPPLQVYHWHEEGFAVPAGATLLATAADFPNQAFAYGRAAFGLQFHPEVTPTVLRRWLDAAPDHLQRPGAQSREVQLADCARFNAALEGWLDGFLDHWLAAAARDRASVPPPVADRPGAAALNR
jgi:GMP synthase (glutamine-hydrolysing)